MMASLTDEFSFVLAACADKPAPVDAERLDWDEVLRLAVRHRVEGLVASAISAENLPEHIAAAFENRRRALAIAYLTQLSETLRLSNLLLGSGIPSIVLKGCALGKIFYAPHPEVRHAWDIDLLVASSDFSEADRLLRRNGYVRTGPSFEPTRKGQSMVRYLLSDYTYSQTETGLTVELHERLVNNPYRLAIPFEDLLGGSVEVGIGDGRVRALGSATLTPYVCAHAAGHAFFRLKWLADVHRLLSSSTPSELSDALATARSWGCERAVAAAISLHAQLIGTTVPTLDQKQSRAVAPLVADCMRAILSPKDLSEHDLRDIPEDLRATAYRMRLGDCWHARLFPILRFLVHADDVRVLGLGVNWLVLYAVLGRFLAAGRLVHRTFSKS